MVLGSLLVLLHYHGGCKWIVIFLVCRQRQLRTKTNTKKMTLVRMSAKLLVDARLHVSFSFPFLFSFPFTLYRKLEKNTPIPSTVIFFVETDVVWNKGETSISRPVLALFPSLIWTWTTILITEELSTSNSCGITTVAAMFLLLY